MRERTVRRPRLPLWLAVVGPAVAWLLHLLVTYGLAYVTCRPGGRIWFVVATAPALTAIAAVMVATRPSRGDHPARSVISGPEGEGGVDIMTRVAWLLAGFFLLVTLMAGVGTILVSPCL